MAKTKEEYNLSPEIEKLAEKLAKDPSSKLFLPLGEEYAKGGMLEEAITVLKDGLKHHPNYISARVALGKVYLKKGLTKEALEEFKRVVTANPDNLLAHKKLVEIHNKLGNIKDAIKSCNTILLLNPKDEEIKGLLKQLEGGAAPPTPEIEAAPKKEQRIEKPPVIEAAMEEKPVASELKPKNFAPKPPEPEFIKIEPEIIKTEEKKAVKEKEAEPEERAKEEPPLFEENAPVWEGKSEEIEEIFKIPEDREMEKTGEMPVMQEEAEGPVYELKEEKAEELDEFLKDIIQPQKTMEAGVKGSEEKKTPLYEIEDEELISFPKDLMQSDDEIIQEAKNKEAEIISMEMPTPREKFEKALAGKPPETQSEEEMIIIEEPESEMPSLEISEDKIKEKKEEVLDIDLSVEEAPKEKGYEDVAAKEEKVAEDGLATETLAELYIKQGFYEKGIEIYRKLLDADPENNILKQRLEDAITLSSLFVGSDKQKAEEIIPGITIDREAAEADAIEIEEIKFVQPEAVKPYQEKPTQQYGGIVIEDKVLPEMPVEKPKEVEKKIVQPSEPKAGKQKAKIHRLQNWLENIKKEQPLR